MQPGRAISRYMILGKLARGGMAEVWLARQGGPAGFNKTLVLKTISTAMAEDPQFVQMFLDEARLAALLNHPNVVQIFDLDVAEGRPFIAMEYLDGRNLAQVLRALKATESVLEPRMAARIIADVCAALEYAHTLSDERGTPLNIIHRDVTPENIFLTYQGQVKVLDFGIAKAAASSHATQPGTIRGKLAYMAPEQVLAEKLDRRVDIWAVGVNLYVMLAGQPPFMASSDVEFMGAILQAKPLPPSALESELPAELDALVMRALEKPRDKRFSTAGEMRAELEAYLRGQPPVSAFEIAQVMERLFPAATDSERVRLNALRTAVPTTSPDDTDAEARPHTAPAIPEVLDTRAFDAMRLADGTTTNGEAVPRTANPATAPITVPDGSPLLAPTVIDDGPADDEKPRRSMVVPAVLAGLLAVGAGAVVLMPSRAPEPAPPVVTAPPPVVTAPPPPAPSQPSGPSEPPAPVEPSEPSQPDEEESPAAPEARRAVDPEMARANPDRGAISISSNTRAEVWLDGKHVGRAPQTIPGLSAGDHRVKLVSALGAVRETSVPVVTGILTERRISFGKGRLTIKVSPWAEVSIDGKVVGTTPLPPQKLLEGTHEVTLANSELKARKTQSVTIRADADEELKIRLGN